jgi:hypothetical protein
MKRGQVVLPKGVTYDGEVPTCVKYKVGQPMGALSSFNMLALTHHMILQVISNSIYQTNQWCDKYEITGDDVVIFDHRIASEYQRLIPLLGLELNLKKSVISSRPSGEYLKKT